MCSCGVFGTADNFTLTNNGTISTRGDRASYSVYVEYCDYATVTNIGLIDTTGETANGITLWGSDATIANHGTLSTSGANSTGIYVWHNTVVDSQNVLINTGTIRATGTRTNAMYGQGIYANATGMTVINSGTVSSWYALYMGQADQTLTLLAGSRIEGGIRFDHADALADGLSASVKLGAEGTFVDGSAMGASLLGTGLTLAGSTSTEARGFVGFDVGFSRGGYDFSAKGEVGYDTADILSTSIQGGIGLHF